MLQMQNISKQFGQVYALQDVTLTVNDATIHAICGENGAGKSTLMKILSGVYAHHMFEGTILLDQVEMQFENIRQSEHAGISIIAQELALVPEMSIAENIFLGHMPLKSGMIDYATMHNETARLLHMLGLELSADTKITELGIGHQQLVEIAKALSKKSKLLILDEPTAALTETESKKLLQLLINLKQQGITLILISHKLEEVFAIADNITVLRDGKTIATKKTTDITTDEIISLMVGRVLTKLYHKPEIETGEVLLEIKNLSTQLAEKSVHKNISLNVKQGEVVGIAGLIGSGRTELLQLLFGARTFKTEGQIFFSNTEYHVRKPQNAIDKGVVLITEDRKKYGLVTDQSILFNNTLSFLKYFLRANTISPEKEISYTNQCITAYNIKANNVQQSIASLSGGNQQKVAISKWLYHTPQLLLADEPTRGVDVGAKAEIYSILYKMAKQKTATLVVSSDLPELMGICDRIYVMCKGSITAMFHRKDFNSEKIMVAAVQ
ncbi:MAG: sugar ABC transporter ATP-binding protein [Bacteroidetes bacterium]|nr:sugar ABC transporter ATP-binding protein [Bacteroidota bacterium]